MSTRRTEMLRKLGASLVDFVMEFTGGLLGSYFGAMVAALVTVMNQNVNPQMMQSSIKSGFGIGFVFWALGVSFLNRVPIQGISRASVGKKLFKLELISSGTALTWSKVTGRWLLSMGSFSIFGGGYLYAFFHPEQRTLHDVLADTDVVPSFESASLEIEPMEEALDPETALQMMIISNAQAERPSATVIQLPLKGKNERKKAA
ncbi:MAG: RDD family protein [Bdellovibrionales bacterium]|nr:RDD family protein [Bdellovibrionales bacterium]